MERKVPRPGEIYDHFKDKPYQIITIATDSETGEQLVVYQALYGDFKSYVRPLAMFMSEVDHVKYPDINQKYRFELRVPKEVTKEDRSLVQEATPTFIEAIKPTLQEAVSPEESIEDNPFKTPDGEVNLLLMKFLDADSFSKKLEVLTSNKKHLNDRIVTDMAVALDLAVDEGPLEQRISGLIYCLQAMCRFEDRRLR